MQASRQAPALHAPNPLSQQVMSSALGPDWGRLFTSFARVPFAVASIGQMHTATLAAAVSPARVAVKPAPHLLPKGLYLERTMQVMKAELADECDYTCEAGFLRAFGDHLGGDVRFTHLDGTSVGTARLAQRDRDEARRPLQRTERFRRWRHDLVARFIELFEFRLMQTDERVELVDFGAARAYSKAFIDDWLRLLQAAARDARAAYLTGAENQVMLDAHVDSLTLLATPFKRGTPQPFAFGQGTAWADVTAQIRAQIPVMLQQHLTPRPQETYSLDRKLSRAFLLAARLGTTVDTRAIWDRVVS
ncbi:hypothetical protein B0H17DRAFT_1202891 [Mycena rosella]|uniref:ABC1 atypical kinase-like domain-containing protein n=1 Tax=Mycena rosella TaxID=1033263 RepID=A0AAD7GCV5_MYCRO|nr:hypothetical protein B0H17DRAFT_1202891 [Mycena rosella]